MPTLSHSLCSVHDLSVVTHDTDTKGGLGNTIAFVSTTLPIKPAFYNFDEGVKDEENTSRA